jgi:hypothetical protein
MNETKESGIKDERKLEKKNERTRYITEDANTLAL